MGEAAAWKAHGANVVAALRDLETRGVVEITALVPQVEGSIFSVLQRTLGQGESAAIAIAFHRRLLVCLDDRRARRSCERLSPAVSWLSTEDIIGQAVRDGHIDRATADAIWLATGIRDPNRRIPPT
jgi:predicted nucleic acid-binding protein